MKDIHAKPPPEGMFQLVTNRWTEPFWQAAREHRLTAARCDECGQFRMPPTPFCPACLSQSVNWPTLSGRGELYSYTVVSRLGGSVPENELPYVPCIVELPDADRIRLVSNVVGCRIDRLRVGLALRLVWHDRADGVSLPFFRPDDEVG